MITTKTGDDGKSRWSGKVVDKDSVLLEAVGTLDELQSLIEDEEIQKDLYEIMGEIGYGEKVTSYQLRVNSFEEEIEKIEKELGPIKEFLVFKSEKARRLNWVRTVCRRAERRLVTLKKKLETRNEKLDPNILIYINRLSDYLFMLARLREEGKHPPTQIATAGKEE